MKTLVVLPSYNEAGNITQLMAALLGLDATLHICVVDDNSPDGTPDVVRAFIAEQTDTEQQRLHLIVRAKKDGRGGAVRHGFEWGLARDEGFGAFVEMDCDFSHDPAALHTGLRLLDEADIVIGARYPDGRIEGWPRRRKVLSFFANQLARTLISRKVADYTNGYRFYTASAAAFLCGRPMRNKGYIYLSESIAALLKAGFRVTAFPIHFVNRTVGESNTTSAEVRAALGGIFRIAWGYRFGDE